MAQGGDKGRVGLRAFFKITKLWELNPVETAQLLGQTDLNAIDAWASEEGPDINKDTLQRISYILGIFKAVNILLPIPERANDWMRRPNKGPIFRGQSALERMTTGKVSDLCLVRNYLNAELNR